MCCNDAGRYRRRGSVQASVTGKWRRFSELALESRDLPDERVMRVGAVKSALLDGGEHMRGWVRECPEFHPAQPEEQILRTDQETRDGVSWRIAEHEQTTRVFGRGSE
jgi:hypothetical protein